MNASSDLSKSPPVWDEIVRQQVKTMRFGVVQIVIHEGRVVQIERTEKVRLDKGEAGHLGEK
jgi:hypothetical protein